MGDALTARGDVLRFDSQPLSDDISIVGRVHLRVALRASRPHFDLCARLCDVHPSGRSYNVCDAVLRQHAPLESSRSHQQMPGSPHYNSLFNLELMFSATAKCFHAGHSIRLLLTGGTFPERARNFGNIEQTVDNEPLEVAPYTLEFIHSEQAPC